MRRIHVACPDDVADELDGLVGERERSRYIVEAVRAQLRRDRLLAALDAREDAPAIEGPSEWDTAEGAAAWVRAQRVEPE